MRIQKISAILASFLIFGIVHAQKNDNCYYVQVVMPVCGSDDNTYMNGGEAYCAGITNYKSGACGAIAEPVVVAESVTTEESGFVKLPQRSEYFGDVDSDSDGISDLIEERLGTDPNNSDTNANNIKDGAEVAMGLSPLNDDLLFADFDKVTWARDYIINMVMRGAIKGYGDGTFRPQANVTRAEILKMMIEGLNYDLAAINNVKQFKDVDPKHWSAPYISFAKGAGVVTGFTDGTFRPNDFITRAEAVKMMTRLVGFPLDVEIDPYFTDINGWQIPYVENARRKGILTASVDKKFRPDDFITRAEVVKMASQYITNRM